jgi:DNA-directed RNA polymerase subunit M/transcription elongation factor TFIIS
MYVAPREYRETVRTWRAHRFTTKTMKKCNVCGWIMLTIDGDDNNIFTCRKCKKNIRLDSSIMMIYHNGHYYHEKCAPPKKERMKDNEK